MLNYFGEFNNNAQPFWSVEHTILLNFEFRIDWTSLRETVRFIFLSSSPNASSAWQNGLGMVSLAVERLQPEGKFWQTSRCPCMIVLRSSGWWAGPSSEYLQLCYWGQVLSSSYNQHFKLCLDTIFEEEWIYRIWCSLLGCAIWQSQVRSQLRSSNADL